MCDTLCAVGHDHSVFAKNSDRPPTEVQLVAAHPRRSGVGTLDTQYLEIPERGAVATVLARPTWLWGAEHGVNEHRVAIGNERISTKLDAATLPDGLIGMDLVRLGLERSRTADEALDVMTGLLGECGQGGAADPHGEAYFSSFLIVDPTSAWVLETAGTTWAAEGVAGSRAISNQISLRRDWTRGSDDLVAGADFEAWSDRIDSSGAGRRLAASCAFLGAHDPDQLAPRQVVAHLRDHGHGPWGLPGGVSVPEPPPAELRPDFTGISVCMHVHEYMTTTSSMVARLPADPEAPARAWVAAGSPCVSVYVPLFPDATDTAGAFPGALADEALWQHNAQLRNRVERHPEAIGTIRAVLDPIEAELWEEADDLVGRPGRWAAAAAEWGRRVTDAAIRLSL
jgi:secernin